MAELRAVGAGRGYLRKQFRDDGTYKQIDGIWHKLCRGISHEEPTYLPWTEKYFYRIKNGKRKGALTPQCRLCMQWKQVDSPGSDHGYIRISTIVKFYQEAVNRIGVEELAKRSGVSSEHILWVLNGKTTYVKKANLKKVMLELISIKRNDEHSISKGALWRARRRAVGSDTKTCRECGIAYGNSEGVWEVSIEGCKTCINRVAHQRKYGRLK